ncbi:MAG: T9SS type A sorting domain-containing protein [Bacteroidota bacterium]|nr:T9SS type A sorting domain-containing protein [Bacteroidota bacterium]
MTKLGLFIAALALSFTMAKAQTLNGPESIEFDPNDGKYFVGNTGTGAILKLSANGTLQNFATGVASGPYGLELVGDTLYACSGGNIKMINRVTGVTIATVTMGGTFMNGITHKGNNLYVTDFSAKKIHRFNLTTRQHNIFCSTINSKTPNGIIYDDINDRLVYCCWGTNAPVHAISFSDSTVTQIGTTTLGNCDGIAMNCSGNFYIASWSPNRVTKFSPTFTTPTTFMSTGISSPADIYYNRAQDSLYVPNGNNTVKKAGDLSCTVSLSENFKDRSYPVLFPNPAGNTINFLKEELTETTECVICDLQGKVMKKLILSVTNTSIDISDLKSGMYIVMLRSANKNIIYKLIKE